MHTLRLETLSPRQLNSLVGRFEALDQAVRADPLTPLQHLPQSQGGPAHDRHAEWEPKWLSTMVLLLTLPDLSPVDHTASQLYQEAAILLGDEHELSHFGCGCRPAPETPSPTNDVDLDAWLSELS